MRASRTSRNYYHMLKALLDDGASVDVASVSSIPRWDAGWVGWAVVLCSYGFILFLGIVSRAFCPVCSCDRFLSPWLWSKLERVPPGQQTDGRTALQLACEESQLGTVICLLDHGASLDHTDVRHVHCGVALLCSLFAHLW